MSFMGGRLLTPQEACARTGKTFDELLELIPVLKVSRLRRLWRFQEKWVDNLLDGGFSWTIYFASRDFEKHHERLGVVYFIEAIGTERVKIGFTSHDTPSARLRRLQTSSPFELRVITSLSGSLGVEKHLHQRHVADRILPTAEWFHLRGKVLDLVEIVREQRRWP